MLIPKDTTVTDFLMQHGLNALERTWQASLNSANDTIQEMGHLLEAGDSKEALNIYREWSANRE